jgi:hypothetical protein
MNQDNNRIPYPELEPRTPPTPPGDKPVAEPDEQAPLGARPKYEDVLDAAVDYTFPCSDPIAVQQSCEDADDAPRA